MNTQDNVTSSRTESRKRLAVLRQLLRDGEAGTQEELCDCLRKKDYDCTQSTISRDLRRIGAIKITSPEGEVTYRLPEDHQAMAPRVTHDLTGLVTEVDWNESMIVLHTTPGSASLIARHLDTIRNVVGILGTIAGDDAIFIAPASTKRMHAIIKKIKEEF